MSLNLLNPGAAAALKTEQVGDDHITYHHDADRAALLAALEAIDPTVLLAAIATALGGTLAVSAQALPLPAGAATQATLVSILNKLIAAPATQALQESILAALAPLSTQATAAAILAALTPEPNVYTLANNIGLAANASSAAVEDIAGGSYILTVTATFNGATVKLQSRGPDGATYVDVPGASLIASGSLGVVVGEGAALRLTATGGAPAGLYASLT